MSITGERLRKQRKRFEISADEVAAELGVSRSTIFRYEYGYIEKVPSSILEKLADILHTTPAYLAGWTNDPNDWEQIGNEQGIYPPKDYEGSYEDYVKYKMYEQQDTLIDEYYDAHPTEDINEPSLIPAELGNYVNMLNERGKEKVIDYARDLSLNPVYQRMSLLNAAHADETSTPEERQAGDDIMMDDSEWG